ncbi:type II toxin-antitoxin system PemK/MazF family toxin [candidate division KSB1 bacterium]|nr:type II toxin-antitoxin system PemK/MazF family toxin [candidate division KSB1 bacterium]MBL7094634.1 type II toxin-antitoxin system PemK/MazF family toxin [candidate division KSB1 bacterium]
MAKFIKGEVVVIPFPFSDLSQAKRRPALVLSSLPGYDLILCQITSQQITDSYAIPLKESDFDRGSLKVESNIRPNRIFTADKAIILYSVGMLKQEKIDFVIDKLIEILKST